MEGDKSAIVDWMLTNKISLDELASYADPTKEARERNLPESPFAALVKNAKGIQLAKGTCSLSHSLAACFT